MNAKNYTCRKMSSPKVVNALRLESRHQLLESSLEPSAFSENWRFLRCTGYKRSSTTGALLGNSTLWGRFRFLLSSWKCYKSQYTNQEYYNGHFKCPLQSLIQHHLSLLPPFTRRKTCLRRQRPYHVHCLHLCLPPKNKQTKRQLRFVYWRCTVSFALRRIHAFSWRDSRSQRRFTL